MDIALRDKFLTLWPKYFNHAELPVTFYYTDKPIGAKYAKDESLPRCVIGALAAIREGKSIYFDGESLRCGNKFLGYSREIMPNFRYFLSYGIEGKTRGERYSKTPEMVDEIVKDTPAFNAPAKYISFKRWDHLAEEDNPAVAIFFATPDVLSGLYTLARFDETDRGAIQAPFGSGCAAIVQNPYIEQQSEHPRAILGMFDPSARVCVPKNVLMLAVPMKKFVKMIENMEESFLITETWQAIQERID